MKYKILADIHCDRIVYFTSIISEHTEIDDNLYVCFYDGELPTTPKQMTLKNCWSWRWNSKDGTLVYAGSNTTFNTTLFDQNKNAAKQVLKNTINKARKAIIDDYAFDAYIQTRIYDELLKPQDKQFYINCIANTLNKDRNEVFKEYDIKRKRFEDILFLSEITKKHFEKLIEECKTSDELYQIRNNIAETNILAKYDEIEKQD